MQYNDDNILVEPIPAPHIPSPPRLVSFGPIECHDGWATDDAPAGPSRWDI